MRLLFALVFITLYFQGYSQKEDALNNLIDQWHMDAASAAFDAYFDATSQNFVFLGTAPEERWTKEEFQDFSKPYFDKKSTWDFKPSSRAWNFSADGNTAWFDEDLVTWMEGCRGTGICSKVGGEWKLSYYNLHVLIENEKIKEFISLRKKQ